MSPWTGRAQPPKRLLLGVAAAFLFLVAHAALAQQPAPGQQPAAGQQPVTAQEPYYLGPPVLDYGWTPGAAPDGTVEDVQEITALHDGHLHLGPMEKPLSFLGDQFSALNEISGLQFAVSYTMPFQQATGGPGDRYGGAGDFRAMVDWTLVGRGTKNTGEFIIAVQNNFGIGSQPPSALRASIGALLGTVTTFNDRGWVLRDAYWSQRLLDGKLRFMIGRAEAVEFIGSHWMESASVSFMNRHFSDNPALEAPGYGGMVGVSVRPNDKFYVTAGSADAYGDTTQININTIGEGAFFTFGEVGFTPTFAGHGEGRYAVGPWYISARPKFGLPSDEGVTAVVDQQLGDRFQFFVRYGYDAQSLSGVHNLGQGGIGYRGLFTNNKSDLSGIAFSVGSSGIANLRSEKVLEMFYRWQATKHGQLSAGVQGIFDPPYDPHASAVAVYWLRLRVAF